MNTNSWDNFATRILIYSANYLDYDGSYYPGGRQRHIKDLSMLIKKWGKKVTVVQKSYESFQKVCPDGINVIGIKANTGAKGDILFAYNAKKIEEKGDVWLYASGEDSWPFFQTNSKAIQHGIWWDGPQSLLVRTIQKVRVFSMLKNTKSVLCVDTNFINWVRTFGYKGYELSKKCEYIPNYVDLSKLSVTKKTKNDKLSIISARRFEPKRGTMLLLDAFKILKDKAIDFEAHICTIGGLEELTEKVQELHLEQFVTISEESMDSVLKMYENYHIAVIPTLWSEGTSLAAIEALSAGLPIVSTSVGGLGNIIISEFNGVFLNPSADSLAHSMAHFNDMDEWERMHLNALNLRTSFDLENWNKKVLEWLKQ